MKNLHDRLSLCKCWVCRPFGEHFNKAISLGSARIKKFLLADKKLCAYQNRKLKSRLGLQCQRWLALADRSYGVDNISTPRKGRVPGYACPGLIEAARRPPDGCARAGVPGYACPGLIEALNLVLGYVSIRSGVPGYACPGLIEATAPRRRRPPKKWCSGVCLPRPH